MCGIAGKLYFDSSKHVVSSEVKKMTDAIAHRGPDDEGVYCSRNVGLGHRRLSIIDLSELGHQPMSDKEGRYWLTFNGEIYNYKSLRKELEQDGVRFRSNTDSEVIIYLYKKYGVDCVQQLRGMFAFAIWDDREQELFLARDRVGQKPLKYYYDGHVFLFASELKAILTQSEVERQVDWAAAQDYLSHLYVPGDRTGFEGIKKLEPAHYLLIKNGQVIKKRYWQLSFSSKFHLTEEEWIDRVGHVLEESVSMRMMSDVPLGAHLSGGIDSSLIVALMAQQSSMPVKTFSIGFEEQTHNELGFARMVADRYGTEHQEFVVKPNAIEVLPKLIRHYEEPYADNSAIPTWYLSELTRQHVTVALNGDGGDENFAGYKRYDLMRYYNRLQAIKILHPFIKSAAAVALKTTKRSFFQKIMTLVDWSKGAPAEFFRNSFGFFRGDELGQLTGGTPTGFIPELFGSSKELDALDQLLFVDFHSYLPNDLLVKVDIASMAHALEVRSPFLDHTLLELTASMPSDFKIRNGVKKYLLKKIAEPHLPKEILQRPKKGFGIPREKWLRGSLNEFMKGRLLDEKFIAHGFNRGVIEQLVKEHVGGRDHSLKLWSLLMLQMWLHEFHS